MADVCLKRQREATQMEEIEETKRHKSYNHILSILEEEEEDPVLQDLTSLITTLQQELSSDSSFDPQINIHNDQDDPKRHISTAIEECPSSSTASSSFPKKEEDDRERVMRLLLEASDDELGLPNREEVVVNSGGLENGHEGLVFDGVDLLSGVDGFVLPDDDLWEFEDHVNVSY